MLAYFQGNWNQRKVWNQLYKCTGTVLSEIGILSEGGKLPSDQMQIN